MVHIARKDRILWQLVGSFFSNARPCSKLNRLPQQFYHKPNSAYLRVVRTINAGVGISYTHNTG